MKSLWLRLLQFLGYRSKCCAAPTVWNEGYGQMYCGKCERRI